jgi:acyl-CoA reductase-like NAD-dependent aldehyde dehydrogenase
VDSRNGLVRKGNYICGSFIKPESVDGYINCINPGDRTDLVGRFAFSAASVEDAVTQAKAAWPEWKALGLNDRARAVQRFRENLASYQESAANLITRESGKPLWEARHEVLATLRELDILLDDGIGRLAPKVLAESKGRTDFRPRGVVGILCPYNPPLLVAAVQTAAAVLSGNAVVFKPSKFTPAVGQFVAETWDRCHLKRGVVNMVQGSGSLVGNLLSSHPGVDALLFTGSFKTSMAVRKAVFKRPELPVIYQTGGKGIAIVLNDAELERSVYEVMVGAFLTAGQRHNSTARVIVTQKIYERWVHELSHRSSQANVGYGFQDKTFMGPLISENLRSRYRKYARAVEARGHRVVLGGSTPKVNKRKGFYVTPSIFAMDVESDHLFLNEEPPGPILLVYRVKDEAAAIDLHNRSVYRLTTSVFTQRTGSKLNRFTDRLQTGALNVNRATIGRSMRLAQMGLGRSSGAVACGLDLVRALSHPRAYLHETRDFDSTMAAPGSNWRETDLVHDALDTDTLDPTVFRGKL